MQGERARANSKHNTQTLEQHMFYYYQTIKKNKFQMLRKTGLVVRATEEKTYFDECCYTNRSVKLVINRGEITNYNEIYIQHVTKERN